MSDGGPSRRRIDGQMRTCWTVKRQGRILELISELEAGVIDGFVVAELVLHACGRGRVGAEIHTTTLDLESVTCNLDTDLLWKVNHELVLRVLVGAMEDKASPVHRRTGGATEVEPVRAILGERDLRAGHEGRRRAVGGGQHIVTGVGWSLVLFQGVVFVEVWFSSKAKDQTTNKDQRITKVHLATLTPMSRVVVYVTHSPLTHAFP